MISARIVRKEVVLGSEGACAGLELSQEKWWVRKPLPRFFLAWCLKAESSHEGHVEKWGQMRARPPGTTSNLNTEEINVVEKGRRFPVPTKADKTD